MARPEPRAKNSFGCHPIMWGKLSEFERHHYNKMFNYMLVHKEAFLEAHPITLDEWEKYVRLTCQLSCDTLRRGRLTKYRR